jgi:hypothetical protein
MSSTRPRLTQFQALAAAILLACACTDEAPPPSPVPLVHGVPGSKPGVERYVLRLDGDPPDVHEHRKLSESDPVAAAAMLDQRRKDMLFARAPLVSAIEAQGGAVVDVWWMANAITIEIAPTSIAALAHASGVARVEPDRLLE